MRVETTAVSKEVLGIIAFLLLMLFLAAFGLHHRVGRLETDMQELRKQK